MQSEQITGKTSGQENTMKSEKTAYWRVNRVSLYLQQSCFSACMTKFWAFLNLYLRYNLLFPKKYVRILKIIKNAHDNIVVQNYFSLYKYPYLITRLHTVCTLRPCVFLNIQLLIFPKILNFFLISILITILSNTDMQQFISPMPACSKCRLFQFLIM